MLASKNRFHRRNHLNYVHRKGRMLRSPSISIRFLDNQKHEDYRVAVMVSKKVAKSAVKRNRIRRRVYSVVEKLQPPLKASVDLIVMVYDEKVAEMDYPELEDTLTKMIDKANLRRS